MRTAPLFAIVAGIFALTLRSSVAASPRPNIILILADDMGFSDAGCYGGEIHTPSIDRLAAEGVRLTRFYNMARCCPTRASLLAGVYPHLCNLTISPGGPRAKRLVNFEASDRISRSTANWPCNRGFDDHWGTIPGVDDYYDPYGLVHNEQTFRPEGEGFYYTDFITDRSVEMVDRFAAGERPFFLYIAYTAPHWPMQAREEDLKPYVKAYRAGWDKIRAARFERQVAMGIVSRQQGLSPRAAYPRLSEGASVLGPWEDAPEKAWQARRMAVYAAMVEAMDRGIGRILDKLRERGLERDTVVIFLSDNGGCAENIHPDCYDVPSKTRDGRAIHVGNDPRFMPGSQEVFQSYGPALNGKPLERGPLFWEHEGNRAVRLGDWKLLAGHGENWQLYNIAADCAEASDLSAANPGRVEELKALYDAWAAHCGVEPWPVRR